MSGKQCRPLSGAAFCLNIYSKYRLYQLHTSANQTVTKWAVWLGSTSLLFNQYNLDGLVVKCVCSNFLRGEVKNTNTPPLYNTCTVLGSTEKSMSAKQQRYIKTKCIDYIEKWPFMVIFLYNLYTLGSHHPTVLYPKSCYNEPCYNEVVPMWCI